MTFLKLNVGLYSNAIRRLFISDDFEMKVNFGSGEEEDFQWQLLSSYTGVIQKAHKIFKNPMTQVVQE